ncbi:MAG TPA: hypothetical protein VFQ22_04745, partial [Longimicrobiales bacterium]|nr:hypothetical protein [Longimicrobiales bacterium]
RELREDRKVPARLLGVAVSGLVAAEAADQLALFEEGGSETERERSLSRVLDRLRDRFGDRIVQPGRLLEDREG